MKIIIDARMYGLEHAGIGRYVMNLVSQLEKIDKKNEYFVLLRKKYYRQLKFKNKRFKKVLVEIPHYSFKEQVFLPVILKKIKPDLVHFPHFNVPIFWQGKYVVTIHDLIKHQSRGIETTTRPTPLYWLKYIVYQLTVFSAVKRATKIITPSKWWKKELAKRYRLKPEKIMVTYEGAGEFLKKQPTISGSTALKKYGISKPFVIYTGSLYPHKNVLRLVRAIKRFNVLFHRLQGDTSRRSSAEGGIAQPRMKPKASKHDNKKLSLVIACARNVFLIRFKKEVEAMTSSPPVKKWGFRQAVSSVFSCPDFYRSKKKKGLDLVVLAGFVPDEELIALYKEAEAFVTPSLLEGFGLPGLEAMAAGLPVISSNASCLPEIYGKAAIYFDPLDVNDMTEKIKLIREDDKTRQKLKKLGLELVERYSWQKMAKETLKVYNESCFRL